ncbi:hypothetical protein M9H77_32646 [Catharanthus roseus]|uniref:Uncharacterized protein n=1 Tax=Catharanthus roseus TaxID=4058 RepID=A0ACC0A4D7_CATRO|nr:hypothetical protein M9H77_32646 [Catharanthus roseus]
MKRTKQGNSSICECEMQDQKKKELYPKVENLKKGQSNWGGAGQGSSAVELHSSSPPRQIRPFVIEKELTVVRGFGLLAVGNFKFSRNDFAVAFGSSFTDSILWLQFLYCVTSFLYGKA